MVAKACVIVDKENRKRITFISIFSSSQFSNSSLLQTPHQTPGTLSPRSSVLLRKVMATLTSLKEEATLRDLLRWIESRDFNMTRRQAVAESQELREEGEDSVRWLSYILDNDQADGESIKMHPVV